jgi:hypothetical protein
MWIILINHTSVSRTNNNQSQEFGKLGGHNAQVMSSSPITSYTAATNNFVVWATRHVPA